jgi:hypothetical protein
MKSAPLVCSMLGLCVQGAPSSGSGTRSDDVRRGAAGRTDTFSCTEGPCAFKASASTPSSDTRRQSLQRLGRPFGPMCSAQWTQSGRAEGAAVVRPCGLVITTLTPSYFFKVANVLLSIFCNNLYIYIYIYQILDIFLVH